LLEVGGSSDEELVTVSLVLLLQAAVVLDEREAAQALAARLACVANLTVADSDLCTCIARHLGDAAVLLGDRAAARTYYAQALESAGRIRFRPEVALTHLRLAELLLEESDNPARSEALEHLDISIPELRDMHMQPALECAEALRDKHRAAAPPTLARSLASDTLTTREREIVSLIAGGLSNREIGERLVITVGTVEVHVKHILGKLNFKSRSQVAVWFGRHHGEDPFLSDELDEAVG
jgi:DNA-binding NarL/FixJ family response regulator